MDHAGFYHQPKFSRFRVPAIVQHPHIKGPKRGPYFRELPIGRFCAAEANDITLTGHVGLRFGFRVVSLKFLVLFLVGLPGGLNS